MNPNYFLSGLAYSVGDSRPIDGLRELEHVNGEVLDGLKARGLREYRQDSRSIPEMCMASALQTLANAKLEPGQIGSIVLATSNANWINHIDQETALFGALHDAGFKKTRLIGLALQACSACGDALQIACNLTANQNGSEKVLVILFGRKENESRLGPAGSTVYSDGAASCIVSAEPGAFEIRATDSFTNMQLGAMGRVGNLAQFQGGVADLHEISKRALNKAGIGAGDVRAMFGTNGSLVHLKVMANAAGIPMDRFYAEDVPCFAHVYSCDNFISLSHYTAKYPPASGDHFLLLEWSPHVVSAAVLRHYA